MNIHRSIRTFLIIGMAAGFGPAFARAGDDAALGFGALRGVTLNAAGQPVAMVSVAIHSMDGSTDRKVVSDGDGVFAADHLKSGPYQITAAKEGLISPPATTVEVAQDQTARPRLVLAAVDTAPVATLGSPAELERELEAMKDRIAVLEAALKARIAAESASPPAASSARPAEAAALPAAPAPAPAPPVPPQAPPAPQAAAAIPEALQAPDSTPGVDNFTPFAYGDFTWLNGSPRNKDTVLDT